VLVFVDVIKPGLVGMRMGVGRPVVLVLVFVYDVVVLVGCVRVGVRFILVMVLVRVRRDVRVLFGHAAPISSLLVSL
jgi:hypothetical protein